MNKIIINGKELYYRNIFGDKYVVQENLSRHCYTSLIPLTVDDVVLDIGAHIGTFSLLSALSPVKKVYAFECEPENFALLERNTRDLENVTIFNYAVVGNDDGKRERSFYPNTMTNTGAGSFYIKKGRRPITVECVPINYVFGMADFTYIKSDCEGAEYDIFDNLTIPLSVRNIVIEFHLSRKEFKLKLPGLLSSITRQGFKMIAPTGDYSKRWTVLGAFTRDGVE